MLSFAVEATHYIKKLNPRATVSNLDRLDSLALISDLYDRGAISVEIAKKNADRITELFVRVPNTFKVRDVLTVILKVNPDALEETKSGIFRVEWK